MCGRFVVKSKAPKLAKAFQASVTESFNPHYNIAPTARIPIVRSLTPEELKNGPLGRSAKGSALDKDLADPSKPQRILKRDYWGLIPYWAKNPKIAYYTSNARADSVAEKPSFKRAFKKMRCLVLMDGFYEWDRSVKPSQPYYFSMRDEEPFACAGLYESWKVKWEEDSRDLEKLEKKGKAPKPVSWPVDLGGVKYKEGEVLESCTIITTDPNPLMAKIHDRMPVILDPKNYDAWLDPELQDTGILKALMKPFPAAKMQSWPVDRAVNKVGEDDSAKCIKKLKED